MSSLDDNLFSADHKGIRSKISGALEAAATAGLFDGQDVHPQAAHVMAAHALSLAAGKMLAAAAAEADGQTDLSPQDTAGLWQETLYRATELFDFYEKMLPKALGMKADKACRRALQKLVEAVKRHRRPWAEICNRLKHNNNFITPITTHWDTGVVVPGFRVSMFKRGEVIANPEFHKKTSSISYGVASRELLYDLLAAENLGVRMIQTVSPSLQPKQGAPMYERFAEELANLPLARSYHEKGQRSVAVAGDGVIALKKVLLPAVGQAAQISTSFRGDGVTRSFQFA